MLWFRIDQYPNKTRNLYTFYFDNLKVWLVQTFEIEFWISFKVNETILLYKMKITFSEIIK